MPFIYRYGQRLIGEGIANAQGKAVSERASFQRIGCSADGHAVGVTAHCKKRKDRVLFPRKRDLLRREQSNHRIVSHQIAPCALILQIAEGLISGIGVISSATCRTQ